MSNYTNLTPTTEDPTDIYGIICVGNDNTAKLLSASSLTLKAADTSSIDLQLSDGVLSANLKPYSINMVNLAQSLSDTLNKANTAIQPSSLGVFIQAFSPALQSISSIDSGDGFLKRQTDGTYTLSNQFNLPLTFSTNGEGVVPGSNYTGLASTTISYNSIGSPSVTGANATGTWNINISGNSNNVNNIVPVSKGGTGSSTMSGARSNLGLTYATPEDIKGYRFLGSTTANSATVSVAVPNTIKEGDFISGSGIIPGTIVIGGGETNSITLSNPISFTSTDSLFVSYKPDRVLTAGIAAPQLCKAWVNFNGVGILNIRSAYNVRSVIDEGIGNYTINFSSPLIDENYSVTGSVGGLGAHSFRVADELANSRTSQSVRIVTLNSASSGADFSYVNIAIFR